VPCGSGQPPEASWTLVLPAVMKGIIWRSSAPTSSIWWALPSSWSWWNRGARAVLGDPLLGEAAVLDLAQDAAHLLAHSFVDHPGPAVKSPYSAVSEIE